MRNALMAAAAVLLVCSMRAEVEIPEDGGDLMLWPANHGRFLFVNTQKTVDGAVFSRPMTMLASFTSIDIGAVTGEMPDLRKVRPELEKLNAKGAIWIVDDPGLPLSLCAPEAGWGVMNVALLVADKPDAAKLAKRIEKMINRTFSAVHQGGRANMSPNCVTETAFDLASLDALICSELSPEPLMRAQSNMVMAGYKTQKVGTYLSACEEGWAPAPTNDVQRKIWNAVHKMPTNTIPILPESKRKR